jgi:radical SAM protein with 4Fe4S-binding SPASM domain
VVREPEERWTDRTSMKAAYRRLTDTLAQNFENAFCVLEDESYRFNPLSDITICELRFTSPAFSAPCGIGSSHIVVQDDGRIASCPMTIREETAKDTAPDLISAMAGTFALDADRRNAREKNCLDCQWFPVCVGGCPVNNERANGDPYTISPLHDFYQYVIPRFLNFCGHKLLQEARRRGIQDYALIDLN